MKKRAERTGINTRTKKRLFLLAGGMLLLDAIFLVLAAWLHELWWNEIVTAAGMCLLLGGIYAGRMKNQAAEHGGVLLGLHALELAVILLSYEAEGMIRPVLAVPMLVSLLIGREAGSMALIFYSVLSAVVCADPTEVLLLYLTAGMAGVCLFAGRRSIREYLAGGMGFLAVYTASNLILFLYAYMQVQGTDILLSLLGAVAQLLPFFVLLPFLSEGGIHLPGVARLSAAVDPDFPPLQEFQKRESVVFKHSRLAARLSAQAAAGIGADALLAEAGGLYHEIGQGIGEDCEKESLQICKKYRLPASVQNIVREHNPDRKTPSSKESAIVMISDTILNMMEQSRKKNTQESVNMEEIINRAFKIRENSGAFLLSGLSEAEIQTLHEFYLHILGRA